MTTTISGRLDGKVLALAGAGGIGDVIAQRLASEGATVMVGDYNGAHAEALAERLRGEGLNVTGMRLDGGDEESVNAFYAATVEHHGGLDGTHVNFTSPVDTSSEQNILEIPLSEWDEVFRVNARGFVLCTRAAVPLLIERGGGSIVYTSSGAAYVGDPVRSAYAMSKESTHALMRHVANTFGGQSVRANVISPGFMLHDALRASVPELAANGAVGNALSTRVGHPNDIAAMSAMLLSEDGSFISGQVIAVDGGSTQRP